MTPAHKGRVKQSNVFTVYFSAGLETTKQEPDDFAMFLKLHRRFSMSNCDYILKD